MPLTIYIQEIQGEEEIFLFLESGLDGFLWTVYIPGLDLGLLGRDSHVFSSNSRILRQRVFNMQGVERWGAVVGIPRFDKLFVPVIPVRQIVEKLRSLDNPVQFVALHGNS